MNRIFPSALFALLVVAWPSALSAQVDKQVEVTKAYVPSLESASKLAIRPDMTDTVMMYPDIDYTITPLVLRTSLAPRPIRPASVTYWEFNRPYTFYAKAGMGYPLRSVADFYAATQNPGTGYAVGYLNHEGRYAPLRNDFGAAFNSVRTTNRIGGAAGIYLGRRLFEGELSYDNRLYHRYGRFLPAGTGFDASDFPGSVVDYGDADLALRIGDAFLDLDRFNFEVAVHGGIFFDHSDVVARARQNRLGARARIGKAFGRHRFTLEAGYEWLDGRKNLSGLRQQQIHAAARYALDGTVSRFELGADYYHDKMTGEDCGNYVIPYARLDFKLGAREFKPFLELDGGVCDNSFRSLALRNPYVAPGSWGTKSSVDYNARIGLGGSLWNNEFDYRVYVAFSIRDYHVYWYGDLFTADDSEAFSGVLTPALSRQTVTSLHGEIIWRPIGQLRFDMGLHGFFYNDEALRINEKRTALGNGDPQFRADASLRYEGRRIACGVSFRAESKRLWSLFVHRGSIAAPERYSVPFAADLGIDFEWRVSGRVALFAEGRNLLDRRLYDYPFYPAYRVSCTAGAKVTF